VARNAQKEFLIGQSQDHMRHIADHLWIASSCCQRYTHELLLASEGLSKGSNGPYQLHQESGC